MKKKGQEFLGMSFGTIFSIILIIFIISVAIYAITYFLGLNKCTQVGLFFSDLQNEIDSAWQSQHYRASFEGALPNGGLLRSGADKVCFGSLDGTPADSGKDVFTEIKEDYDIVGEHNIFIYPKLCDELSSTKLNHIKNPERFFCTDILNGKVQITLEKQTSETLVSIIP